MKNRFKGYLVLFFALGIGIFSGCIKNGTTRTVNPYMTANIGNYTFSAENTSAYTINPQQTDTGTTMVITGVLPNTDEKLIVTITKFTDSQGTYSIVEGQAFAIYEHNGILSPAQGGVVAVSKTTSNTIIGYFSFNTNDGYNVLNGTYCVGKPNVP